MATIYDTLVLAKLETTKGTDAAPVPASNAVRVLNRPWPKVDGKPIDRQAVKQTMGNLPHLINPDASMTCELQVELKGSGTAGTAPEYAPMIQAARTSETINAGVSAVYQPTSAAASEKSATVYVYADGLLWKFIGAVADVKIDGAIGQVATATVTISAPYAAPTAAAVPTGAVFPSDNVQPLVFSSASVVTQGGAINVGSFSLSFGNDVQERVLTGEHAFEVANRAPEFTVNRKSVSTASEWDALMNATAATLQVTLGSIAGNIVQIDASNALRKSIGYGEQGAAIMQDVAFGLYETASDDQFTVTIK